MRSFIPTFYTNWLDRRPDRAVLAGLLLAAAGLCLLLTLLPRSAVAEVVNTLLPSSSRSSSVRTALLDQHRVLFGLATLGLFATTIAAPALFGGLHRFLIWLSRWDRRVFLIVLIGVTVLVRLALVDRMLPVVPNEDTGHYYQLANTLLDEGRYIEYASKPSEPDGYRAWRLPGYPAAWSVFLLPFGRGEWTAVLLNTLWMVVLVLSIYGLVRKLASEGAARLAALACAIYPALITASLVAMNELQFAALLCLAAYLLFGGSGKGRVFAGGIALGLAALTRGNGLPVFLVLTVAYPLYLFFRERGGWTWRPLLMRSAVLALGFILTITPWMVRNRVVLGEWVALATSGGANMWIGHHPGGTGLHRRGSTPPFPAGAGELERSSYGAHKSLEYWLDEPVANLRIGARIVVNILKVDDGLLPILFQGRGERGPTARLARIGLFVLFNLVYYAMWGLVAFWTATWVLGRWPPDHRPGILVFLAVLYVGSYIPFIGWARYKIPALPLLVAAAAIVLASLARERSALETPEASRSEPLPVGAA